MISLVTVSFFFTDLYRLLEDHARENDGYQMHCNFSQMLLKDHFQASQQAEHTLIQVRCLTFTFFWQRDLY